MMDLVIYQDGGRKKMMKTNMIYLKTFEAFRSKADYDRWRKAAELTTIIVPVDGLDKYEKMSGFMRHMKINLVMKSILK